MFSQEDVRESRDTRCADLFNTYHQGYFLLTWMIFNPNMESDIITYPCLVSILLQGATARNFSPWWRHHMETFSALLALCAGSSPVTCEFLSQRHVTNNFDVFFDLHPNIQLGEQPRRRWFETPLRSLLRHWWLHDRLYNNVRETQGHLRLPSQVHSAFCDSPARYYRHHRTANCRIK